jgi:hypothetical protein
VDIGTYVNKFTNSSGNGFVFESFFYMALSDINVRIITTTASTLPLTDGNSTARKPILYRASIKEAKFTVDRRERVTKGSGDSQRSYYLVWSREGEVFCVADTWSFFSFDSSDRYGKLRDGSQVQASVAGWRVPFLSWYRNVVEIKSVAP